jgi:hypothetical protein
MCSYASTKASVWRPAGWRPSADIRLQPDRRSWTITFTSTRLTDFAEQADRGRAASIPTYSQRPPAAVVQDARLDFKAGRSKKPLHLLARCWRMSATTSKDA